MGAEQGAIDVGNGAAVHPAIAQYMKQQVDENQKKLDEKKKKEEARRKRKEEKNKKPTVEESLENVHPIIRQQILAEKKEKEREQKKKEEKKRKKEKEEKDKLEAEKQAKIQNVHPALQKLVEEKIDNERAKSAKR